MLDIWSKIFLHFFLYLKKTQLICLVFCSVIFSDIHPFICLVIYPVICYVIHLNIHPVICLVIHPVICSVIWCFPVWQSSFIKLSDGGLHWEFIQTFYPYIWDLTRMVNINPIDNNAGKYLGSSDQYSKITLKLWWWAHSSHFLSFFCIWHVECLEDILSNSPSSSSDGCWTMRLATMRLLCCARTLFNGHSLRHSINYDGLNQLLEIFTCHRYWVSVTSKEMTWA